MKRTVVSLAASLVTCLAFGPGTVAAEDVRIGTIFPLTGNMAFGGNEGFMGTEIAREIVNERGGVWGGTKIVFVQADASDQTAATNEMNRLISRENIKLVIGSFSSAIAFTASQVAERNKIIYWENHGVADTIARRGFRYLFKTNVNATGTGGGAATFAATYLTKALTIAPKDLKVAVAWEDGTYGASVGKAAFERAKELGLNVVANEGYSAKSADLSPLILKLKGLNPDVLLVAGIGQDAVLFWSQARKLDFNVKAVVATSGGWGVPDFAKNMGNGANGVFSSDFPTEVNPEALTPHARDLAREFVKRFQAKKGTRPTGNAWLAFAGTMVLFEEVLPKAGSLDPDKIRDAAFSLDLPNGSMANGCGVKFIPHDQFDGGKNERAFAIVGQWQDGVMKVIGPDKLAAGKPILVPLPQWADRK
jgi:branched-chain amino acid transport system substrate-binding protein